MQDCSPRYQTSEFFRENEGETMPSFEPPIAMAMQTANGDPEKDGRRNPSSIDRRKWASRMIWNVKGVRYERDCHSKSERGMR